MLATRDSISLGLRILVSADEFAPRGLFKLQSRIVQFRAIEFFVFRRYLGPGTQA